MVWRKTSAALTAALVLAAALAAGQEPPSRFTGEPISLNLKDVDLHDFFRLVHEISGLNIIVDPGVRGTLTLVLIDVPWDQALDTVLKTHGLVSQLEGNVLQIMTRETAKKEYEAQKELARTAEQAVARRTVTYTLSYARAAEVAQILQRFLSPRGDISVDQRTNTLIITDVPAVLEQLLGPLPLQPPSARSRVEEPPRSQAAGQPRYHALALRDPVAYSVYSCEIRGEWLHYHTSYGARSRVPVARVEWSRTTCAVPPAPGQ